MATISPNRSRSSACQTLICKSTTKSELYGLEGQELAKKIQEVSQVFQDEPIQRLLKSLSEEYNRRQQNLLKYLNDLSLETQSEECEFTYVVIEMAGQVWKKLRAYFYTKERFLEIPDACPGNNDNFMFTWSRKEHYFECEIFGSGEVEFFYRNRQTGQNWGEDTTLEKLVSEISPDIVEKTTLFTW